MNRKLVIGKKIVGGLPKEKAPRKKWHWGIKKNLLLSPEEETLVVKLYGRETDKYPLVFVDMDPERVLGTVEITTTLKRSLDRAAWHPTSFDSIRLVATRHTLITRCTCTLPVALAALRPNHEQNLPISEAHISPGDTVTISIPDPLITFR